MQRVPATIVVGSAAFLVGVPSVLGGGWWQDVRIAGRPILDAVDFLAANVLLSVVGMAVVLYVGWVLPRGESLAGSGLSLRLARSWLAAIRYLAPIALALVLIALWY